MKTCGGWRKIFVSPTPNNWIPRDEKEKRGPQGPLFALAPMPARYELVWHQNLSLTAALRQIPTTKLSGLV